MARKVDRINHLIVVSAHYREQLAAMENEFADLHNVARGSSDEDDLLSVIRDGEDYESVMIGIRKRHSARSKS